MSGHRRPEPPEPRPNRPRPVGSPTVTRRDRRTARPWHAVTRPTVPEPVRVARAAECAECPHYAPRSTRCGVCGCLMAVKCRIPDAECPIGRWTRWPTE